MSQEDSHEARRGSDRSERTKRKGRGGADGESGSEDDDRSRQEAREERRRKKREKQGSGRVNDWGEEITGDGEGNPDMKPMPSAVDHVAEQAEWLRRRREKTTNAAGGVYMPPHKLREMQAGLNKQDEKYQRMQWDALRKSINGLINKVNTTNIKNIIPEIFSENLVRGRGLVCRSVMKAQMASPGFTHVYAALIAVINTKMPEIGELLLKRIIMQFRRAYRRNDKLVCLACTKFLAHLVNQQVAHELLALQLLTLLLEKPTDDSVEVAVDFVKEVGQVLQELSPRGAHGLFERFRAILHEGEIDKRVQYMIEALMVVRKNNFEKYPGVLPELDLVEVDDQITHELSLTEQYDIDKGLDIFHKDPEWEENEKAYSLIKKEILGESEVEDEDDGTKQPGEVSSEEEEAEPMKIEDRSERDIINLRRTIYLTIMSSMDFEECAHKLLKSQSQVAGHEKEVCNMILECCAQERTYLRFYGLLGERFCRLSTVYEEQFDECFAMHYATIHRFETGKLRNIGKFFGHLLCSDSFDWSVLSYIHLNEEETTSSSRIFIKILFRELSEMMGLAKLKQRLEEPTLAEHFLGLFPRDHPKNTRFAINFFTSIGLGGLTEGLRSHLKAAPKQIMAQQQQFESDSESSSSSSSSESSASSDSSSESSSESESEEEKKKKKKSKNKKEGGDKAKAVKEEKGKEKEKEKKGKDKNKDKNGDGVSAVKQEPASPERPPARAADSRRDDRREERRGESPVRAERREERREERRDRSPAQKSTTEKRSDKSRGDKHDKEKEKEKERDEVRVKQEPQSSGEEDNGPRRDRERDREKEKDRERDRRDKDRDGSKSQSRERNGRERGRDKDKEKEKDRGGKDRRDKDKEKQKERPVKQEPRSESRSPPKKHSDRERDRDRERERRR